MGRAYRDHVLIAGARALLGALVAAVSSLTVLAGGLEFSGPDGAQTLKPAMDARLQTSFESPCNCAESADQSAPHGIRSGAISGVFAVDGAEIGLSLTRGDPGWGELAVFNPSVRVQTADGIVYVAKALGAFKVMETVGTPGLGLLAFACEGETARISLSVEATLLRAKSWFSGPYDVSDTRQLTGKIELPVEQVSKSCR